MSPTQRSLKLLRSQGWTCWITEHWNPHAGIRQDLFGFADLVALAKDNVLLVQTTSGSHVSARIEKIRQNPIALLWLSSPTRWLVIHGWRKPAKSRSWVCRTVHLRKTVDGITTFEGGFHDPASVAI